jgi:hypothetical protein
MTMHNRIALTSAASFPPCTLASTTSPLLSRIRLQNMFFAAKSRALSHYRTLYIVTHSSNYNTCLISSWEALRNCCLRAVNWLV